MQLPSLSLYLSQVPVSIPPVYEAHAYCMLTPCFRYYSRVYGNYIATMHSIIQGSNECRRTLALMLGLA